MNTRKKQNKKALVFGLVAKSVIWMFCAAVSVIGL